MISALPQSRVLFFPLSLLRDLSFPIVTEILLWALGEFPSPWCANTVGAWSVKFEPTWQTGTSPSSVMNSLRWCCRGWISWLSTMGKKATVTGSERVASIYLNRQILDVWRVWHRLCSSELLHILTLCPVSASLATWTSCCVIQSIVLRIDFCLLWKLHGEHYPPLSYMENANNEIQCSGFFLHYELHGFTSML